MAKLPHHWLDFTTKSIKKAKMFWPRLSFPKRLHASFYRKKVTPS